MINIKRYETSLEQVWNGFVSRSKNATFLLNRRFMDYHSDRFDDHSLLIYDDERLLALFPACEFIQEAHVSSHGGLTYGGILSDKKMSAPLMLEIVEQMISYYRALKFNTITYKTIPHIYHAYPAEEDLYALFRVEARLTRVDNSTTISSDGRYPFSKGKKNGLAKAKKHDLYIEHRADADRIDAFCALLNITLESQHDAKATHSEEELKLLSARFPDHVFCHQVIEDHQTVAGVLIFCTPYVAHTQYMASSSRGRDIGALDYLLHHLITEKYAHIPYFNFGISNENQGRVLNSGLCRQKEMLGGRSTAHLTYTIDL